MLGFNVRADTAARQKSDQDGIDIRYYSIIYELIDDVKDAMSGKLAPEHRETILGVAQVREVFRSSKFGAAAGCMVMEGVIHRNKPIRVLRDDVVIFQGELESLRRYKDVVDEVRAGMECGLAVKVITTSNLLIRLRFMMFKWLNGVFNGGWTTLKANGGFSTARAF